MNPTSGTSVGSSGAGQEPWVRVTTSEGFAPWLAAEGISLAFTTYQAGKLFLVGHGSEGRITVFERTFNRCMGLWAEPVDGQTLWMGTLFQVWRLENALRPKSFHQGHDRLYVPRIGYTTGDVDAHDIVVERGGRILFANTRFGCVAALSDRDSFTPLWKPPFITELQPDDRCHLNGLALDPQDGRLRYVTACGTSDTPEGWRDHRHDGGVVIDVRSNETIAGGLSMPHSPRCHRDQLWVHNSGAGCFGRVDLARGVFEPVTFCPGYLRGLAFSGDYAIVGLSLPRRDRGFHGLPLQDRLAADRIEPFCALSVIDLRTCREAHRLQLEGDVSELYDVVVLRSAVRPMALGFSTDEIKHVLSIGNPSDL